MIREGVFLTPHPSYLKMNKIIAMATGDDGMDIYNSEILAAFQ